MSFRQSMKNLFLHISPVYRKLDAVQQQLFALADGRKEALETAARLETAADSAAREQSGLAILDGTEYSRYAIPLDYLPSRNLKPRWGYTTGAMPKIKEWFDSYADEYKQMLRYMRTLQVEHIPKTFVSGGGDTFLDRGLRMPLRSARAVCDGPAVQAGALC